MAEMPAEFYIRLSEACLSVEFVPSDLIEASGHLAHGTLVSDHLCSSLGSFYGWRIMCTRRKIHVGSGVFCVF